MDESSDTDDSGPSLQSVVGSLVIGTTLILAFALLAAGQWWFWVVFVIGFAGVLPMVPTLTAWYESRSQSSTEESDPLDALRDRYARGEIDEAEFERRLDALLETESERDAESTDEHISIERGRE
jgi:uncharacterized membrane protein